MPSLGRPKNNVITDIVTRAMIPVIQLFALYVVFHGHYSPGGGFQGGALIASSILLARMVLGFERSQYLFPSRLGTPLGLAGIALYAGVGLVALPLGGNLLDYSYLPLGLPSDMLRNWGILVRRDRRRPRRDRARWCPSSTTSPPVDGRNRCRWN